MGCVRLCVHIGRGVYISEHILQQLPLLIIAGINAILIDFIAMIRLYTQAHTRRALACYKYYICIAVLPPLSHQ